MLVWILQLYIQCIIHKNSINDIAISRSCGRRKWKRKTNVFDRNFFITFSSVNLINRLLSFCCCDVRKRVQKLFLFTKYSFCVAANIQWQNKNLIFNIAFVCVCMFDENTHGWTYGNDHTSFGFPEGSQFISKGSFDNCFHSFIILRWLFLLI
jgi:hypothetical protein